MNNTKTRRFGITLKIAMLAWLITFVTMSIFVVVIIPQQKRTFLENLESKANGVAVSIRDVAAGAVVNEDYGTLVEHCMQIVKGDKSIEYLVITKNNGESWIHEKSGWRCSPLPDQWHSTTRAPSGGISVVSEFHRRVFHYSQPFDYSGIQWGWVHVGLSLETYDHSVATVYRRTGILALICILLSLLASVLYTRLLVRPILTLQSVVRRIASGDLSARAVIHTGDEVELLANSFNAMAGSLQQSHAEVLNYQQTLEQRVKDRTIELEKEIAERKQAEGALRDSEARYRTLFDNAAEAVWLMTDVFLDCNEMACTLWACNREDIIGHTPAEFSPPTQPDGKDSAQAAKERIDAALGGHPQLFYWLHKRKDGTLVDAEISLTDVTVGGQRLLLAMGRDITERKRAQTQVEDLHRQLLDISREAGMAEVATNVLHNVGNVLNSVNVSTALVSKKIRESRVSSLAKVVALMRAHQNDLPAFLTQDPNGMELCDYLDNLAQYLSKEQTGILTEIESLNANIEHIKEIVTMQQGYARAYGIVETLPIVDLVEDTLRLNAGALARHQVQVIRDYTATPSVPVDKHKVLQILINLVRNAKYALDESGRKDKLLTIRVATDHDDFVGISVIDNGVGIPPENLTRIFAHGFTTRKDGHGFGLHSGAVAVKEMGGSLSVHSDGPGQGAAFTLSLPLHQKHEAL